MAAEGPAPPSPGGRCGGWRPGPAVGAAALGLAVLAGLLALGGPEAGPEVSTAEGAPPAGAGGHVPPVADPDAVALLRRADEASRELAWQGTQFVARWSGDEASSAVVDVVHLPGRGSVVRPASGAVGGAAGALVPEGGASTPTAPLGLLQRHYVLREAGEGRCAGRVADIVEAWPRGTVATAPAARFWVDRDTGLVLRREVADATGRTVLASAFLDLQVPPPQASTAARGAAPAGPEFEPADPGALRAEGWAVPPVLAGLELHETRVAGSGADRLVHLAYTDGLFGVSVFAQHGELDPDALQDWDLRRVGAGEVWVADSVPSRVAWTAGGTVLTVLADAPASTLEEAVSGLPHDEPGPVEGIAAELRERLARGLARVADRVEPSDA